MPVIKAETGEEGRGGIVPFSNLAPPTRFAWEVDLVLDRYLRLSVHTGGRAYAALRMPRVCSKTVTAAQRRCTVYHIAERTSSSASDSGPSDPQRGAELTCAD